MKNIESLIRISNDIDPMTLLVSNVRIAEAGEFANTDAGAIVPDLSTMRAFDIDRDGAVIATDETMSSALVEVFDPPSDLLAAVIDHAGGHARDLDRMAALGRLSAIGKLYDAAYILERRSLPGRLVATTWPLSNQAPGMHVDNRDEQPCSTRIENSRRRMGINAGPGNRWLLLCFPDIVTIADILGKGQDFIPRTPDFQEFVTTHPDQAQSVWVPLPPGKAYKMPSDSIGHDGSTWGADEESSMYYFLGHWARGALTTNS